MAREFLFIAPDSAEKVFRSIASELETAGRLAFHSLLLFRPERAQTSWSVEAEVDELAEVTRPESRYDLVGYSGGASIALAFCAAHPERVRSLCLIEPPWIGNDIWSDTEREFVARFDALLNEDDLAINVGFRQLFAPGAAAVDETDLAETERWARALRNVWRGFRRTALDRTTFETLATPVLLPVGEFSAAKLGEQARFLIERVFSDARLLMIADSDHFNIFKIGAAPIAKALSDT